MSRAAMYCQAEAMDDLGIIYGKFPCVMQGLTEAVASYHQPLSTLAGIDRLPVSALCVRVSAAPLSGSEGLTASMIYVPCSITLAT